MIPQEAAIGPPSIAEGTAPHEILVDAAEVSKKYCRDFRKSLLYSILDMARSLVPGGLLRPVLRQHEFWAVKDISFQLRRGESLALIGDNGAGKSTLLKVLCGQRQLTTGKVTIRGRAVSLIELGLGFDPVLSGRENAFINAAIFGVARKEFEKTIQEIIEFSGLEDFIDAAVQTYSSGMKARLGFAIATHLDPDILIVDEVLAVGDIRFRLKCVRHILGYLKRGGSLILVSHDPFLVQSICQRCIILDQGRMIFDGNAIDGVDRYFQIARQVMREELSQKNDPDREDEAISPTWEKDWIAAGEQIDQPELDAESPVAIDDAEITPAGDHQLVTGGAAVVTLTCRALTDMEVGWAFNICTVDLQTSIVTCGVGEERRGVRIRKGLNRLQCRIPNLPLCAGTFALRTAVVDLETVSPLALRGFENRPGFFTVHAGEKSLRSNAQIGMNDLIAMPVEFLGVTSAAPQSQ